MSLQHTPVKKSSKKKNTYILQIPEMLMPSHKIGIPKNIPLPLIIKNGKNIQSDYGVTATKYFPTTDVCHMQWEYVATQRYMGQKLASTVVEYLDKETNKPVLILFPTTCHIFKEYSKNYMSRLNHASRRDLEYEMQKRSRLIESMLIAERRQHNK